MKQKYKIFLYGSKKSEISMEKKLSIPQAVYQCFI